MKKIAILLLLQISFVGLFAQTTVKISGSIKSADGKFVEAAVVMLSRVKDSVLLKSTLTNKEGIYEFDKLTQGNYLITVNAVGFETKKNKSISILAENAVTQVEPILLTAVSSELKGVVVTSRKPFIENKIDKMVVNVDASPTNTGLSALEVLEKSPGINIDNEDNISIKGKQGVIILIDGKPSYLNGKDLANFLRNMPSTQLDVLEIMTQPSSKYDASGNSGVINIKTKKSKANGFNGSVSSTAIIANYFKHTHSLNLNLRKNKWNIFGNYSFSGWKGFNDINISRSFRANASTAANRYFKQNTYGVFKGFPHTFKVGADYSLSSKTTIGAVVSGLLDDRQFVSEGVNKIYDSLNNQVQYNVSNTKNKDPWNNLSANINFRHLIDKKGKELTADIDYAMFRTDGNQYSDNYLYNMSGNLVESPFLLRGYLPASIDIYTAKVDYSQPLPGDARLEAGFKSSYVKTDNDAQYTLYDAVQDQWVNDVTRSNHFIYKENINAAYINYNRQIKKWGIQLGLRAEQTTAEGNQIMKNSVFKRNYTQLFPTAFISYKPNDNNTYAVNFGRRIERPGYQDLNPFQFLLDRYSYREGNPMLQPQFSYNAELSYNYKGQLNIAANISSTNDIMNDVIKTNKDGENFSTFQTKENIASRLNIGLAINYNKQIKKWWTTNVFVNVYNNQFSGFIGAEKIDFSVTAFNTNISNQFVMGKGWSGEMSGFFNSRNLISSVIVAQPQGIFSLGVGKQILQQKGTIRFNMRDPFWLMKFNGTTEMDKFVANIDSRWDNRRWIFTFSYRFGKSIQQQQRRRNMASQDEQNRVGIGGQQ